MLHHGDLNLPELEGKHYGGTNRGNAITGVKVPADEEVWQTTYKEKIDIFGPQGRVKMGGSTAAKCGRQKRENESIEPLMFHCWPQNIYEEFNHMFAVRTVLDLSPGCGIYAQACLRNSTGYVGFCWTPLHRERMEQRLKLCLLREMVDESSPLYSAVVADHIDFNPNDQANDAGSADGQKPTSRKQKAETKKRAQKAASAKGKNNKNGASDDVEPPAKKKPRKTKPDNAKNPQDINDAGEDDDDDEDDEDGSDWDLSE